MEALQQTVNKRNRLNQGQGLAEYSLILSLVALVCVAILVVLGRSTKNTIYKVTCATSSTDPQCSCINEKLTVTSTYPNGCFGTSPNATLSVKVTSSCASTSLTVGPNTYANPANVTWSPAPVCNGGATTFAVKSSQSGGTINNYNASRP